jgi:hypothetical protein
VMAERHETKNIRDETRKGFKWDIDQVSWQYLMQHKKKSELIMHNARTKQTEEYWHACHEPWDPKGIFTKNITKIR